MARMIDADELEMFPYSEVAGTEEQIADWIEQVGLSGDDTASRARNLCWKVIEGFINVVKTQPTLTQPNEPLTCDGCISLGTSYGPCVNCIRSRLREDMYRRPPEGEEET